MLEGRDEFVNRYLRSNMRTEAELLAAEQEFFDRVWYDRTLSGEERRGAGGEKLSDELIKKIEAARNEVDAKYGKGSLGPYNQFEWGMINGKLSALRWVLGDEWDFLDT